MADIRLWHFRVERQTGSTDEYYIQAADLYGAFKQFYEAFKPWNLVGLMIAEVNDDEQQKERPGSAVFRENRIP